MKSCRLNCGSIRNVPLIQYLATLSGSLCMMTCGMHFGWPSPSLPILFNSALHITNDQGSWIAVISLAGSALGVISSIFISLNVIGRKTATLLTLFPYLIGWILIYYFSESVVMLLVARFIAGTSDGVIFVSFPMYLSEIVDASVRGMLSSSLTTSWILGILLINVIGSHFTIETAALISSIFPVLCFITFCWMPESPYYLLIKGNLEAARRSLMILKGTHEVEDDLQRITKGIKERTENGGSWCNLFTIKSNRKVLLITVGLRGVQQLCGISAIIFYAQTIFQEANGVMSSSTAATIYFGIQVALCGCSSLIVDKTGRKPLLIISVIGAALALCTLGIYLYISTVANINTSSVSWIPIAALIFYVVMFSVGMQTIPLLLSSELIATNVKALTLSLGNLCFCVFVTVISKFFQFTKDNYGLYVPFFSFALCCVLGLFFVIFCVPETKGKTLEEIQLALKGDANVASVNA